MSDDCRLSIVGEGVILPLSLYFLDPIILWQD